MQSPKAIATYGAEISRHPIGTGPFEFVSWSPDTFHVRRNEHYWKAGLPHVNAVTLRGILENGSRIAALRAGEAQFIYPLPTEMLPVVEQDKRFTVTNDPSILVRYVSMNVMKKPFDDLRVRKALNYAVDKEAFIKVVLNGDAESLRSAIAPRLTFYKEQKEYSYDPIKARRLLTEAGYPDGFQTTMWARNATTDVRALEFLQQQLAVVGVKVNVQPLEVGVLVQKLLAVKKPADATVEMYAGAFSPSTGDADWGLRATFSTSGFPPGLYNTAYYSNADADKDIRAGLTTIDAPRRAAAYAAAQAQIWDDAPWIFLAVENNLAAQSSNLSGVYVVLDGTLVMEDAQLH